MTKRKVLPEAMLLHIHEELANPTRTVYLPLADIEMPLWLSASADPYTTYLIRKALEDYLGGAT